MRIAPCLHPPKFSKGFCPERHQTQLRQALQPRAPSRCLAVLFFFGQERQWLLLEMQRQYRVPGQEKQWFFLGYKSNTGSLGTKNSGSSMGRKGSSKIEVLDELDLSADEKKELAVSMHQNSKMEKKQKRKGKNRAWRNLLLLCYSEICEKPGCQKEASNLQDKFHAESHV